MQPQTIERRVEKLETRMTAIEQLPARIDALTGRFDTLVTKVDGLATAFADLRVEMRQGFADAETRAVARARETRDHARLLFEETVKRIAVIGEGAAGRSDQRTE